MQQDILMEELKDTGEEEIEESKRDPRLIFPDNED